MAIAYNLPVRRSRRASAALLAFLLVASSAWAVSEGDTLAKVLAEKGKPQTQMTAGAMEVLSYPDAVIKLKDGVVVSVRVQVPPKPSTAPAPAKTAVRTAENIPALKQKLDGAVARVIEIVNQPVPFVERTKDMDVSVESFHDGATRPDFGSVDVRKTQEEPATHGHEYTMFSEHPNVAWSTSDIEFNSMTKYFYQDRTVPKKRLTEEEMVEVNKLYRTIAYCELRLGQLGFQGVVP